MFFDSDPQRRYISGGHVYCPVRRDDSDVERCFSCGWLTGLDEGAHPYIECLGQAPEPAPVPPPGGGELGMPDPLFIHWWFRDHRTTPR